MKLARNAMELLPMACPRYIMTHTLGSGGVESTRSESAGGASCVVDRVAKFVCSNRVAIFVCVNCIAVLICANWVAVFVDLAGRSVLVLVLCHFQGNEQKRRHQLIVYGYV
jgi:hypothetical protein